MDESDAFDELLAFLDYAADKGLMPAATATALAVATRNVVEVLGADERGDVRQLDLDVVVRRFQTKRARDFSADTLKEYGRRFRRAVELFTAWREDPANFRVKTRATAPNRTKSGATSVVREESPSRPAPTTSQPDEPVPLAPTTAGTYQMVVPLGRDRFVTLANVPPDLTTAEAERLAAFVRLLPVES
ncbi:MAG TPA: hypothetical protein VGD56_06890 [Gemmatirosa sp.]